jgi:hypothetical protein
MDAASSLFERARDALRRYDSATADQLERAWQRRPWTVTITGDDSLGELLTAVCGEWVASGPSLCVKRGPRARFRAVREDGTVEQHALALPGEDREILASRAAAAREEFGERVHAIEKVGTAVPLIVRRRPQWWQLWLWPFYLLLSWVYRRRLVAVERAVGAGDDARRDVEAAELELATTDARARQLRVRYGESLRAVASHRGVRELEIEVSDGPLPEGVELTTAAKDGVDLVLTAREAGAAIAKLAELAASGRAAALARQAREAITAAAAAMNERIARAEDDFRARLAKLEAMRIGDPEGFGQSVRARLRPSVIASVRATIEHASTHLGSELAQLSQEWIGAIAGTADADALSAAVERIEVSAPNVTQRIADEVRLLVSNAVAGIAHDLYPELVAAMRPHGLPEPPRGARIEVEPVELLPSLGGTGAKLGGTLNRLTGLFRGFDAKKLDTREKAHARLEHMKEIAHAELLDAEPKLHDAISAAIGEELGTLVAMQQQWLDTAQIAEREAVVREREQLAQVAAQRDAAFRAADDLADELARTGRAA